MSEALLESHPLDTLFESHNFGWRARAFRQIADSLLELKRPVFIVETGTMRPPRAPDLEYEDGQSTLVWDAVAQLTNGKVVSIDIASEHIEYAKPKVTPFTTLLLGDSINILSRLNPSAPIDLLYLDSMDFKEENALESTLHHAGELAAIWSKLGSGCIVAVDDCPLPFVGKHALVRCFFELLANIHPVTLGNVCWWRRP